MMALPKQLKRASVALLVSALLSSLQQVRSNVIEYVSQAVGFGVEQQGDPSAVPANVIDGLNTNLLDAWQGSDGGLHW